MTESQIQISIMEYLNYVLPDSTRAVHTPNGGVRDARTGAKLKREGVKAGVPDITLYRANGNYAFMEVKTQKGKLQPNQIEWRDWCQENNIPWALVRGIPDVKTFLKQCQIHTKNKQEQK